MYTRVLQWTITNRENVTEEARWSVAWWFVAIHRVERGNPESFIYENYGDFSGTRSFFLGTDALRPQYLLF